MAIVQKKFVTNGVKTWESASVRVKRFLEIASDRHDRTAIDNQLLYCLVEAKSGAAGERQMLMDHVLEREATSGVPNHALVHALAYHTVLVLKDFASETLELRSPDGALHAVTGQELTDRLANATDDLILIQELRAIWAIDLGGAKFYGRAYSILTCVRNHIILLAMGEDKDVLTLLDGLRPKLRSALGWLSIRNELVSFIEPCLPSQLMKAFATPLHG